MPAFFLLCFCFCSFFFISFTHFHLLISTIVLIGQLTSYCSFQVPDCNISYASYFFLKVLFVLLYKLIRLQYIVYIVYNVFIIVFFSLTFLQCILGLRLSLAIAHSGWNHTSPYDSKCAAVGSNAINIKCFLFTTTFNW